MCLFLKIESIKLLVEIVLLNGTVIREIDDFCKNGYVLKLFEYKDVWVIFEKIQIKEYLDVFSDKSEAERAFDRIKTEYENG